MKTKQVTRYTCEHCGKKGYSANHMAKHERHCTKNPARVCRVCGMLEHDQPNLAKVMEPLPNADDFLVRRDDPITGITINEYIDSVKLNEAVSAVLPTVRERAGNCPACIMAALRQRNIPVPAITEFNFTKEMQAIWSDINDRDIY